MFSSANDDSHRLRLELAEKICQFLRFESESDSNNICESSKESLKVLVGCVEQAFSLSKPLIDRPASDDLLRIYAKHATILKPENRCIQKEQKPITDVKGTPGDLKASDALPIKPGVGDNIKTFDDLIEKHLRENDIQSVTKRANESIPQREFLKKGQGLKRFALFNPIANRGPLNSFNSNCFNVSRQLNLSKPPPIIMHDPKRPISRRKTFVKPKTDKDLARTSTDIAVLVSKLGSTVIHERPLPEQVPLFDDESESAPQIEPSKPSLPPPSTDNVHEPSCLLSRRETFVKPKIDNDLVSSTPSDLHAPNDIVIDELPETKDVAASDDESEPAPENIISECQNKKTTLEKVECKESESRRYNLRNRKPLSTVQAHEPPKAAKGNSKPNKVKKSKATSIIECHVTNSIY